MEPPLQVIFVEDEIIAVTGGLCKIRVVAEAVQPVVVLVTTILYVPAWLTKGESVVGPETILPLVVVQAYVKLLPCDDPVPLICNCGTRQFRFPDAAATAVGGVVLVGTLTVAVLLQAVVVLVTRKVYTPVELTVGVRIVLLPTILPPLEAVHK